MLLIVCLVGFAGAVVFAVLFAIMGLKGKSVKLPVIGLAACALLVIVVGVLSFLGIGVPSDTAGEGDGVNVSRGLFSVTITVPAEFLDEGITQEQLDADVEERGFKSAQLNEDGSVTYVISKSKHKELMQEIRESIDSGLAELAESEDAPNIVRVEANEDYSQYKVVISTEEVGFTESFAALALYFNSGMYHAFNGTQIDNVNIQYVNDETGKVIQEANSADLGGSEDEPDDDVPALPGEEGKTGYSVGDSISLDDITVTLVDVYESNGSDFAAPDDGKVFVICEFTIENNSEEDIAVSSALSFEAYIDDYTTGMSLSAMMSSDKQQLDGSVAAGKKMNGVIGYEADAGWSSIEVRFKPDVWSRSGFVFTYSK